MVTELRDAEGGEVENPLGSLRSVEPTSEADLIIGDHVMLLNHSAYDVVNDAIGCAWRLENAVVDALSHLGIRHIDMPFSSQRVWAAIQEAKK